MYTANTTSTSSTDTGVNNTAGIPAQIWNYFVELDPQSRARAIQSLIAEYSLPAINMPLAGREIQNSENFYFECGEICDYTDLSTWTNLKTAKIGRYTGGRIIFPPSITALECGDINSNAVLDLSHCSGLKIIKIGTLASGGVIKLPASITSFECETPYPPLDLSHCTALKVVKFRDFYGTVKLPISVTDLELRIQAHTLAELLTSLPNLTTFKLRPHDGYAGDTVVCTCTFPFSLTSFECGDITSYITIDLSKCKNLTRVKMGKLNGGKLLLPSPNQN